MYIKKIKVQNFLSFKKIDLTLQKFNVIIGPNAAGKSNFIKIFEFVKQIAEIGLNKAILNQGGIRYLKNFNCEDSKNIIIEIEVECENEKPNLFYEGDSKENPIGILVCNFSYHLELKITNDKRNWLINEEILATENKFFRVKRTKDEYDAIGEIANLKFIFQNKNGEMSYNIVEKDIPEQLIDFVTLISTMKDFRKGKINIKESLLERSIYAPIYFEINSFIKNFSVYNFNPQFSKGLIPLAESPELDKDGSNLPIILNRILENNDQRERFLTHLKNFLPFIEEVQTRKRGMKFIELGLNEIFFKKKFIPSFLISDGTINIIIYIVLLYFEEKELIIIEEPERNIHPKLIEEIIQTIKDVSKRMNKQIILTTHNPLIVKYTGIENILTIYRDNKGFSTIEYPNEKEDIKIFLKNKLGIDELFIENFI